MWNLIKGVFGLLHAVYKVQIGHVFLIWGVGWIVNDFAPPSLVTKFWIGVGYVAGLFRVGL